MRPDPITIEDDDIETYAIEVGFRGEVFPFEVYDELVNEHYVTDSFEEILYWARDNFIGRYNTVEAFIESQLSEYLDQIPDFLRRHIDLEAVYEEIESEFVEIEGCFFNFC